MTWIVIRYCFPVSGVAHLHGYSVDESMPTNRKYGITLHPPEDGMRTFSFSAENETDKKRFVELYRVKSSFPPQMS